jgi:hypothetical protein
LMLGLSALSLLFAWITWKVSGFLTAPSGSVRD